MSTEIASLYATIGARTDDFERGLNRVSKGLSAFEQIGIGALRRVGEFAIDGVGKAFESLGDTIASGMDFNAMQEQATVAFTTMLGSAEKAQAFLGEMQAFARTTPFEYPDLLVASRRLMALGFAADEVLPTLENIGNAAAAMGGGQQMIDRVSTALGQMKAKGRVQAEEMMQLTENGIAAWDMLAKALGVDVATAMEMVTKKQVDAATGIEAIQKGISERFGGMMDKQSTTWQGLISNLKDSFGMLSGRVMKPFFDVAEKGLKFLVDFISSDEFSKGIDSFVGNITKGLDFVASAVERFTSTFSVDISILTSKNASWGEKMVAVWDMLYTTGVKIWGSLLDSFGRMIPDILDKLGEWGGALWNWLVSNLPTWIDNLGDWAIAAWQWLVDVTPKALAQLGNWAVALWGWLTSNLPTWVNNLATWAEAAWRWLSDVIPVVAAKIGEWGSALFAWINTNYPTWVQTLGNWANAAWTWLADVIPTVVTQIGNWGTAVLTWVTTNTPVWQATLTEWGKAAWQWLADVLPQVTTTVAQWGLNVIGWFIDSLPAFANIMLSWGAWLVDWIGFAAPKAIDALASFIQGLRGEGDNTGANAFGQMVADWARYLWVWIGNEAIPQVVPAFGKFIDAVMGAGGSLLTSLSNLAVQLGATLWQWIATAAPIALQKITDWGTALWQWVSQYAPIWGETLWQWAVMAWDWIVQATPKALDYLWEWGKTLWQWALDNAPTWGEKLWEWAKYAWDWLVGSNGIVWIAADKLGQWSLAIYDWVTDPNNVTYWADQLMTWAGYAWDWLVGENGVVWMATGKLGEWATAIYDWISKPENRQQWVDELQNWGGDVWGWLAGPDGAVQQTKTQLEIWRDQFIAPGGPGAKVVYWLATSMPNAAAQTGVALGILADSWKIFNDEFTDTSGNIERDYSKFWSSLRTTLDTGLGYAIMQVGVGVSNMALAFAALHSAVNGDWEGMWTALNKIGENQAGLLVSEMTFKASLMETAMNAAGEAVPKGFKDGIDKGKTGAFDSMQDFAGGVSESFTRPLMINSPSRLFEGFGTYVVEGFENGFSTRWERFREHSAPTVESWVSWFQGIFGIHSPSTLFYGFGSNIVEGLAQGIEASSGMVQDALTSIMPAALNPNQSLISALGLDKAYAFIDNLKQMGANAEKSLMAGNVAKGNIAYDFAGALMKESAGNSIASLGEHIQGMLTQLGAKGVKGPEENLLSAMDFLDRLVNGNLATPVTPASGPATGGIDPATMIVDTLKAILAELRNNGAIDKQGFDRLVNVLGRSSSGAGVADVGFMAGGRR